MNTIKIKKSPTADSRTCDSSKVSKEQLLSSSKQHINDVHSVLLAIGKTLDNTGYEHDFDKVLGIDDFYEDFKTNFETTKWWDNHRKVNRHHLDKEDGVPKDVDLLDVLEHIADCITAGMARKGEVYELKLPDELLQRAFTNTVELLKKNIEVED